MEHSSPRAQDAFEPLTARRRRSAAPSAARPDRPNPSLVAIIISWILCWRTSSPVECLEVGNGRPFTFRELKKATKNFSKKLVLGEGGFGKVYKGVLKNGITVAVKRGPPRSDFVSDSDFNHSLTQFRAEVQNISGLRHDNLVSLIGYCDERNERILVYDFMANGTLRSFLYGSPDMPVLDWQKRLEICIGAAKGLNHLHMCSENGIIHRDVKSSNILLDANFVAKVADFGLTKIGPAPDKSHVTTDVKGTRGYFDPDYASTRHRHLTKKSDVYSFGIVLLEVLCGRGPVDDSLHWQQVFLAQWAMERLEKGLMDEIIDKKIKGTITEYSLTMFVYLVKQCLAATGELRPSMSDVVGMLEDILELQNEDPNDSCLIRYLEATKPRSII